MNRELAYLKHKEKMREINSARNEEMRAKIVSKFQATLAVLEGFATAQSIPEKPALPTALPVAMNEQALQNISYRNYMVRKHLEQAHRTMDDVLKVPAKSFAGLLCERVLVQEQAILRLLGLLNIPCA